MAAPEIFPFPGETIPAPSPWDCLRSLPADARNRPFFAWEAPGCEEIAGVGAALSFGASGRDRFAKIRGAATRALARTRLRDAAMNGGSGPVAVGGFSFDEEATPTAQPAFPEAFFFIPARLFRREAGGETRETRWIAEDSALRDVDGIASPEEGARRAAEEDVPTEAAPSWNRGGWDEAVHETLVRIREGAFSKAVLARSIEVRLGPGAPVFETFDSLRSAYPTCFRFLISDGCGNVFLGASPERLARLRHDELSTEAVAGTLRCESGDDPGALAAALLQSAKDRSEHAIVLEHLLETLRPMCLTLASHEEPEVMRLPHLLHLRTPVRGRAVGAHVIDLVSRLHPTPAVAGWPRGASLEWIRSVEPCPRGWYAGPVGWFDARGEGDFAVGIRSLAVRGDRARVFAGAGIVEGSEPELEWNETELKMKGILDAVARD